MDLLNIFLTSGNTEIKPEKGNQISPKYVSDIPKSPINGCKSKEKKWSNNQVGGWLHYILFVTIKKASENSHRITYIPSLSTPTSALTLLASHFHQELWIKQHNKGEHPTLDSWIIWGNYYTDISIKICKKNLQNQNQFVFLDSPQKSTEQLF